MLFADRIEVWNPGGLPGDLTVDQLRLPHHSVPRNHLLCEPLFLARYIERAGTGTLDMIRLCAEAGLPEPQFRSEGEHFITVIWRDWDDMLVELGLSSRQCEMVVYVKTHGKISNADYQKEWGVSRNTASRDLDALCNQGVFIKKGTTGIQAPYPIHRSQNNPDR